MTSVQLGSYTPPTEKYEYIDITLGIFFDGTLNNKTNTESRVSPKPGDTSFKKYGEGDEESSYYNDWSNVARLWDNYELIASKVTYQPNHSDTFDLFDKKTLYKSPKGYINEK